MKKHSKLWGYSLLPMLLLPIVCLAFAPNCIQDRILFEFVYTACQRNCDRYTTIVYSDGRYVSERVFKDQGDSGSARLITTKEESRMEPNVLNQLVGWAEQSDFLDAQSEYTVRVAQDYPTQMTINYHMQGRTKTVKVYNYVIGNDLEKGRIPTAVFKLANWAEPYFFPERREINRVIRSSPSRDIVRCL